MKTLNCMARLLAAAGAATLTTALFSTVVSLAEPQRAELLAKNAAQRQVGAARTALQIAQAR